MQLGMSGFAGHCKALIISYRKAYFPQALLEEISYFVSGAGGRIRAYSTRENTIGFESKIETMNPLQTLVKHIPFYSVLSAHKSSGRINPISQGEEGIQIYSVGTHFQGGPIQAKTDSRRVKSACH